MKENQYNSANVSNNSNNDKQKNAYEGPNIEENVPQVIMKKDFMSDVDKRKKRRKQQLNSSTKPPTLTDPSDTIAPQQDKTLARHSEETPSVNTVIEPSRIGEKSHIGMVRERLSSRYNRYISSETLLLHFPGLNNLPEVIIDEIFQREKTIDDFLLLLRRAIALNNDLNYEECEPDCALQHT